MKHVLVISYHFPPAGGVPVRRALRTVRNLPAYGWRCSVLSADRPYDPFHPEDPEGLLHLPPIVRLLRPPARAGLERALVAGFAVLQRARALLPSAPALKTTGPPGGSLRRLLYDSVAFPDPKRPWVRGAVAEASRAAREDPYDAVLALGYPWSAFLVGSALRRALSVPLVLDFRDAWTENPRGLWTSARHAALERRLVREADSVILATDGIRDGLRRRNPELAADHFVTITNGYDPSEFPEPDSALRDPERMVLTYTGTFNDAWPPSPADQTPYYMLEALTRLSAEVRSALRVRLVGRVGAAHRRHVEAAGLASIVQVIGPVGHARALQHQLAADVLFLVVGTSEGSAAILTGKLVEYIGARRPVLVLGGESEATRLVRSRGLGWVEPPDDPELIAARLAALVSDWRAGRLAGPSPEVPELSAPLLAGRLATVLERGRERSATP